MMTKLEAPEEERVSPGTIPTVDDIQIRHFIICRNSIVDNDNTFTATGIFEYFSIRDHLSPAEFNLVIGLAFLNPGKQYAFHLLVSQRDDIIGEAFSEVEVDKPNEVMNLQYENVVLPILDAIPVRFDLFMDKSLIGRHFVMARREES